MRNRVRCDVQPDPMFPGLRPRQGSVVSHSRAIGGDTSEVRGSVGLQFDPFVPALVRQHDTPGRNLQQRRPILRSRAGAAPGAARCPTTTVNNSSWQTLFMRTKRSGRLRIENKRESTSRKREGAFPNCRDGYCAAFSKRYPRPKNVGSKGSSHHSGRNGGWSKSRRKRIIDPSLSSMSAIVNLPSFFVRIVERAVSAAQLEISQIERTFIDPEILLADRRTGPAHFALQHVERCGVGHVARPEEIGQIARARRREFRASLPRP